MPRIILDEPLEGDLFLGDTTLRAHVEPVSAVPTRVTFFVDGKEACALTVPPWACLVHAGSGAASHVVTVLATFPGNRTSRADAHTTAMTVLESASVRRVLVPVVVTDKKGHPITGLTKDSFRVLEDGKAQEIESVDAESPSLDVTLAVDVSSSTVPSMALIRSAVVGFGTNLDTSDALTLIAFNDRMYVLGRAMTGHRDLGTFLDGAKATGGTALYDTMIRAAELPAVGVSYRVLVVFTDGVDTTSLAPATEVERRLKAVDVTMYVVSLRSGGQSKDAAILMQNLARATGGRWIQIDNLKRLGPELLGILDDLKHQYVLSYVPPSPADGQFHTITVEVTDHKGAVVRARQGYTAHN